MIALVDYATGNIRSVTNALQRAGVTEWQLTADPVLLRRADKVILPGVGEASSAMKQLQARNLDTLLPTLTQPVLGICIGAQLMCLSSEEGDTTCMEIFPTRVRRFQTDTDLSLKIPHMGWNRITHLQSPLLKGIPEGAYVYYVHSYYPEVCGSTIARTEYGNLFSGALHRDNFYATQFHPEKSGTVGALILQNFLNL